MLIERLCIFYCSNIIILRILLSIPIFVKHHFVKKCVEVKKSDGETCKTKTSIVKIYEIIIVA